MSYCNHDRDALSDAPILKCECGALVNPETGDEIEKLPTIAELAAVLSRIDRTGGLTYNRWSYQELAQQIIDELTG
jgi:hypothetical protein